MDIKEFTVEEVVPGKDEVLREQGITSENQVSPMIAQILDESMDMFVADARPVALSKAISPDEFEAVYRGEGKNEEPAPLAGIFPRAAGLRLFALTMGEEISSVIEKLFGKNDFAVAYMLDTIASLAAEKTVNLLEKTFFDYQNGDSIYLEDIHVLGYSPGYCGWHISAQRTLFNFLQPEKIGITINESCLMTPLKSVSGVLVAGPKEIHIFSSKYTFCKSCKTYSCRPRIKQLSDS